MHLLADIREDDRPDILDTAVLKEAVASTWAHISDSASITPCLIDRYYASGFTLKKHLDFFVAK
jgi:hypothetical protein